MRGRVLNHNDDAGPTSSSVRGLAVPSQLESISRLEERIAVLEQALASSTASNSALAACAAQPASGNGGDARSKEVTLDRGVGASETETIDSISSAAFPAVATLPAHQQKFILITGGSGFVGSHLVDVLMMQGHVVVVLDNLFTGRRANVKHWDGHGSFRFVVHDVTQPLPAAEVLLAPWKGLRAGSLWFDQIYHLACPASPPRYQRDMIFTTRTSVDGTRHVLELATAHTQGSSTTTKSTGIATTSNSKSSAKPSRVLFTSTSEVYGDPEVNPQPEGYRGSVNTLGPRACYDEGKRAAETLCYSYALQHGAEVRIARIFNTFGPRMDPDDGRVVSNFIKQALRGQELTIYGDGSQTRSFQYVSDLVTGLVALMNSDDPSLAITQASVGPYAVNIGNPEERTILDFAKKIQTIMKERRTASAASGAAPTTTIATTTTTTAEPTASIGGEISIKHLPRTQDDPRQRRPDITRAKQVLGGWSPKVPLDEGLAHTIRYFVRELNLNVNPQPQQKQQKQDQGRGEKNAAAAAEAPLLWVAEAVNSALTDAQKGLLPLPSDTDK